MMYKKIDELIGNTPMMEFGALEKELGLDAKIYGKLEQFNPGGSIKDRVALSIIDEAQKAERLTQNTTVIEPTSGNTGIGLALVCAARKIKLIIVMPDSMSEERRKLIASYGAELVLTDGALGMKGAIDKANELHKQISNSIIAGQFDNPANPLAHYKTTGPEIWEQMCGKVDIVVAGTGTGGTITGIGKYLKEQNPNIEVVAVEPKSSAVLSGKKPGIHKIQGIGAGFIPKIYDCKVVDKVMTVTDIEAYKMGQKIAKNQAMLVGISAGCAVAAACKLAKKQDNIGKNIVAIIPDTGEHYLSTPNYL